MAIFLLLVIAAIVLGIIGVVAKGLVYLLVIGVVVLVADFVLLGLRLGRRRRRLPEGRPKWAAGAVLESSLSGPPGP
ncbi:hypothetical protein ABZ669_25610 [Streptomyces hirsutus]|uniref:hypothetical protein n=1 Tax=Streptomyces hirsutus TaxID=35620 RepID=UPI0033DFA152